MCRTHDQVQLRYTLSSKVQIRNFVISYIVLILSEQKTHIVEIDDLIKILNQVMLPLRRCRFIATVHAINCSCEKNYCCGQIDSRSLSLHKIGNGIFCVRRTSIRHTQRRLQIKVGPLTAFPSHTKKCCTARK